MPGHHDPLQLFHAAFAAIGKEDWIGLARMCDPVSLQEFRQHYVRMLEQTPRMAKAEDYRAHSPEMPQEVAEYLAGRVNDSSGAESLVRGDFPTVSSTVELLSLTPVELFAAWLLGQSPRVQLEIQARDARLPAKAVARIRDSLPEPIPTPAVLGVLPDGADLAHVVYRSSLAEEGGTGVGVEEAAFEERVRDRPAVWVESLRRGTDGRWGLIADHHLLGLGHNVFFTFVDEHEGLT